jgi:acid phosphatase family membrane protein YuiD
MAIIGTAEVEILPDSKNFASKATKDLDSQVGKLAKQAAGVFAGVFAAQKTFSFFKSSIAEGQEARKVAAQTAAVIKSTGGVANVTAASVDKLSTAISNKVGIDDEAIASAENLLLTFTNLRNEAGAGNDIFDQATKTLIDMGVALKTGPTGSAIQLGKALNDPTKGIVALTRVGVTFTAKQKEQIKTLQATGDILGAQKIILKELNTEFGGSAEAVATAEEKLSVTWSNVKEKIGTILLPALDKAAKGLSKALDFAFAPNATTGKSNFDAGVATIQDFFDGVLVGAKTHGAAVSAEVAKAFGLSEAPLSQRVAATGEAGLLGVTLAQVQHDKEILAIADDNASTLDKVKSKLNNTLDNLFGGGGHQTNPSKIGDQVTFLEDLGHSVNDFITTITGVQNVDINPFHGFLDGLTEIKTAFPAGLRQLASDIHLDDLFGFVNDPANRPDKVFGRFAVTAADAFVAALQAAFGGIVTRVVNIILGAVNGVGAIIDVAISLPGRFFHIGVSIVDGIIRGIVSKAGDIVHAITGLIPDSFHVPGTNFNIPIPNPLKLFGGAEGGDVTSGGILLVGERGPELVRLPTGSQIVPNGFGRLAPLSSAAAVGVGGGDATSLAVTNHISIPHAKEMSPLQQGDLVGRAIGLALTSAVA